MVESIDTWRARLRVPLSRSAAIVYMPEKFLEHDPPLTGKGFEGAGPSRGSLEYGPPVTKHRIVRGKPSRSSGVTRNCGITSLPRSPERPGLKHSRSGRNYAASVGNNSLILSGSRPAFG